MVQNIIPYNMGKDYRHNICSYSYKKCNKEVAEIIF